MFLPEDVYYYPRHMLRNRDWNKGILLTCSNNCRPEDFTEFFFDFINKIFFKKSQVEDTQIKELITCLKFI